MSSTAVFPIGHGAGPLVHADQPAHHVVRIGRTAEQLTEGEFGLWVLAHRGPRTAAELVDAGHSEQEVDGLVRRGVLASVADPTAFAESYRLVPLFLGLGNSPDELEQFAIGVPGLEPLARVGPAAFELWQWGWVAPSLWAHCEVLATIGEQEAGQQGRPEAHVGFVLELLPALLSGFVAFLDPVAES